MKLRLDKDSELPVYVQLTEELMYKIATGELKPGDSLPSRHALARRLKVHPNTVGKAYQELVSRRLCVRRHGRAHEVRQPGEPDQPSVDKDLDDLINDTIRAATELGYTFRQLRQRVEERLAARRPSHIVVVSADFGMRLLIQQELRRTIGFTVRECAPEDFLDRPEIAEDGLLVGPPGAISQVSPALTKDHPKLPVTFQLADEYIDLIKKLAKPSLIAVISVSQLLLQTAEGILTPVMGRQHSLRTYLLPDAEDVNLASADLVICDSIARRRVQARKLVEYRVVSGKTLEMVSAAMRS